MKKGRSVLEAERLEARQLLDASWWPGEAALVHPLTAEDGLVGKDREGSIAECLHTAPAQLDLGRTPAPLLPSEELESFFAQPEELKKLFALEENGASESSFLPLELAEDRRSDGPAIQAQAERSLLGWRFLRNYAHKAIRSSGLSPRAADPEDLVHQIFVEWWEEVGAENRALGNLLDREAEEFQLLRRIVPRVLSRARYEHGKLARMVEDAEAAVVVGAPDRDWQDVWLDLESGVGKLEAREKLLLELRRQGKTFDEIGPEMGMSKQWASDVFQSVVGRLQPLYSRL